MRLKHNQHTAPEKISHLISIKNLVIKINKTYEVHDSNGREFLIITLSLSLKKKMDTIVDCTGNKTNK